MKKNILSELLFVSAISFVTASEPTPLAAKLLTKENIVEVALAGNSFVDATQGQALGVKDRVRTGRLSRAAVRLSDLSFLRVNELTQLEILPPEQSASKPGLDVKQGEIYFFSREKRQEVRIVTPVATGGLRGTEFHVAVAASGATTFSMFDGSVELVNPLGRVIVQRGEVGTVQPGQAPRKTAMVEAKSIIQWCLYYPGVVDFEALPLSDAERHRASASLAAYQQGDLLGALEKFRAGWRPDSDAWRVYHAAVLLAVGQVEKARGELRGVNENTPGREALEQLIAAVKFEKFSRTDIPATASDWMAESYYQQSRAHLQAALDAAHKATQLAPGFGFAWSRLAELQFSFGRTQDALRSTERALALTPRNAQAVALQGFLFAAQNRTGMAKEKFDQAIALDGGLGNAWLGRGLTLIRQGKGGAGHADLQAAAAIEPDRSILHSYLGKAFTDIGFDDGAQRELERARQIDPNDPTPLLYSALQKHQEHRYNESIRDLEESQRLNDNRGVFRSQFLLDQDSAVRGANLASIFRSNGMKDVSIREAVRAVQSDYSNPSAHLFLSNSYAERDDPRQYAFTLRDRATVKREFLLATLLSPVGGGTLSQFVSAEEYSRLLVADGSGLSSNTSYSTDGIVQQIASLYGTYGNFSYAVDTEYFYDRGKRPNSEFSASIITPQMKFQLGVNDTAYFGGRFTGGNHGDVRQVIDPKDVRLGAAATASFQPNVIQAGWNHEWEPGVHTLLLFGRLSSASEIYGGFPSQYYLERSILTYSADLQHIWQAGGNTLIIGTLYQSGEFGNERRLSIGGVPAPIMQGLGTFDFGAPYILKNRSNNSFDQVTGYVYELIRPVRWLMLTAGISYDCINHPDTNAPANTTQSTDYQLSPKAGFVFQPARNVTFRGAYTRAISGIDSDVSNQLEPALVAGFPQVFNQLFPGSVAGGEIAPKFEVWGLSADMKLKTGTYLGIEGTILRSESFRKGPLQSDEHNVIATVYQLLGNEWSVGARYRYTEAELSGTQAATLGSNNTGSSVLHQLQLFANYNHPSGFFSRAEALWSGQNNSGSVPVLEGDYFWQFNTYMGYRFHRNLAEASVGFLNITGRDYRLTPLTVYDDLPRDRTLFLNLRFQF